MLCLGFSEVSQIFKQDFCFLSQPLDGFFGDIRLLLTTHSSLLINEVNSEIDRLLYHPGVLFVFLRTEDYNGSCSVQSRFVLLQKHRRAVCKCGNDLAAEAV